MIEMREAFREIYAALKRLDKPTGKIKAKKEKKVEKKD
jgi:hypothetical protein